MQTELWERPSKPDYKMILRDADIGDRFGVKDKGIVVATFIKYNNKKRCYYHVEGGGFLSPYDIATNYKHIWDLHTN